MKKRFVPLVLAFMMILSLSASATEPRISEIIPQLSFDGTTANYFVAITNLGKDIEATITLWRGNRVIEFWSGRGSSALGINGSIGVTKGEEYVLSVTGSISGIPLDVVNISGTC